MEIRNILKKMAPAGLQERYRKIREGIIKAEFRIFRLFPIRKNKVVFMNVWGYGDNPKWIAEEYENLLLEMLKEETGASGTGEALLSSAENIGIIQNRLESIYFVTGRIPKTRRRINAGTEEAMYSGIHFLKNNSVKAVYALATARIWVDCNRKEAYITKRKKQCYIQTWHGSLPLKKIEGDCRDALSQEYLDNARRDTEMTDIYISNSEFCNGIYRRAFGFNGKIFCFGSARLDALLKPSSDRIKKTKYAVLSGLSRDELIKLVNDVRMKASEDTDGTVSGRLTFDKYTDRQLAKHLAGQENIKLCLYAPTYRDDDSTVLKKASESSLSIVEALEEKFGGKFVVVTRLHPLAMSRVSQRDSIYLDFEDDSEAVVNGNEFDDIYTLMEAADVLITDYSNTLFEFAYAKKPVFLYAPDSDEYVGSRGLYFDYDSLPYPISKDKNQLRRNIITYNHASYEEKQKEFFDRLSLTENGNASRKQAKLLLRLLDRKK